MRNLIKNILVFVGNIYFSTVHLLKKKNPCVKILIYHDIPPEYEDNFKDHLSTLKKSFDFITPAQFHKYLDGEFPLERDSLMVTFDDGFVSSYTSTVKILDPLDISALFFICSGFIDSGVDGNWRAYTSKYICDNNITETEVKDWQSPMSWEQVLQLKENGHMIGGHTRNHLRLSTVKDIKKITSEISDDKIKLEEKLGEKISTIAYPYGDINSISPDALSVIDSIYKFCYSGVRGNNYANEQKMTLKRDVAGFYLKTADVKFIANGGYDWYYYKDRIRLHNMVSR